MRLRLRLLLWFIAFAVGPAAALAVVAYVNVGRADEEFVLEHLTTAARSRAASIRSCMEMHRFQAGLLAGRRAESSALDPALAYDGRPASEFLYGLVEPGGAFRSLGTTLGPGLAPEELRSLRGGGYLRKGHHALVGVPLADGGAAVAAVPMALLEGFLADLSGLGRTGETYLLDERGASLGGHRAEFQQAAAGAPRLRAPEQPSVYAGYRATQVLGASASAGSWTVVAEMERAEAAGPLRRLAGTLLLLGAGAFLLVMGGLLFAGRRAEKALVAATASVLQAARGEFGGEVRTRSLEDLNVLRDALNTMHGRLKARDAEIFRQKQELFCQRCELERLNAEVAQSDRLKSEFVANMSHEIRTPLHSILSLSEVMRKETSGPLTAEQRRQVAIIERNGEALHRMLGDILDFSKIEAGRMPVFPEPLSPAALLAGVRDAVAPLAEAKGIAVRLEAAPGLAPIRSDGEKVHRILLNLAHNAVKFTEKGEVLLRAEAQEGGGVLFLVRDTGPGVAPALLERIFEPFCQGAATQSGSRSGTGLGLSIARSLAALLGGRVSVESTPGEGSSFTLVLPARCPTRGASAGSPRSGERQLLVVGATPPAGDALAAELRAAGFHASRAVCGRDVRRAVTDSAVAAMLLDVGVVGSDGLETFGALGPLLEGSSIPILGYRLDPASQRGALLGRMQLEPAAGGGATLTAPGSPPLPMPPKVAPEDRARAEAWLASCPAPEWRPVHEFVRGLAAPIDSLFETAAGPPRARRSAARRVLLLEPDEDGRFAASLQLEQLGFSVRAAARVGDVPDPENFDVVVTEVGLPDASRAVEALRARTNAPVVVLTSDARAETRAAALRAGAVAVLSKPCRTESLAEALRAERREVDA
ncbi:MAG: hybrid sensor histidine kinase/response regulator [Planctomycetaceae bacterium]